MASNLVKKGSREECVEKCRSLQREGKSFRECLYGKEVLIKQSKQQRKRLIVRRKKKSKMKYKTNVRICKSKADCPKEHKCGNKRGRTDGICIFQGKRHGKYKVELNVRSRLAAKKRKGEKAKSDHTSLDDYFAVPYIEEADDDDLDTIEDVDTIAAVGKVLMTGGLSRPDQLDGIDADDAKALAATLTWG